MILDVQQNQQQFQTTNIKELLSKIVPIEPVTKIQNYILSREPTMQLNHELGAKSKKYTDT